MRPSAIKRVLVKAIQSRIRILLIGPPGVGKTAILHWSKAEVERIIGSEIDLTTLYVSISDPTDFKGFYCIIDGKPEIMPFGELEKIFNSNRLHIVFLDDFGQGAPAVQAAAMSFLDRVKNNPNICVIAASNRREDRANVSGMLEPVKSRFDSILTMDFDMDDWTAWALEQVAAGRLPLPLVAFNRFRPSLMYSVKPSADLVNGPCPRTVEALGHLMLMNPDPEDEYELYTGAVGEAYATELLGFLPIWRKLPSIDAILTNPDAVTLPPVSDKYAPSIYFAVSTALAKKATENNFELIVKFSKKLPADFAVALITDCIRTEPEVQNTAAFIQWQVENKNVMI